MSEKLKPININGLELQHPVMNGAGPIKLLKHVRQIAESKAAAVVVGSITVEERSGNAGTTYYVEADKRFSLNSKGLPNYGIKFYQKNLSEMVKIAHDHGKPLIMSIAGFSPEEYAQLAKMVSEYKVDGLELNLGCPNVLEKDGKQKEITSFNQDLTGETLWKTQQVVGSEIWTTVKLSPFSNPLGLMAIAAIIGESKMVNAVTTTNTFPNAYAFNDVGSIAVDPNNGLGSLGGKAMKPIGLGQVKQLREVLPANIRLIGVGGISNRKDVDDYLSAGADAVQITTEFINFGPAIFDAILRE
jgi:dihydroorotate dehydrogenase (fumarate)